MEADNALILSANPQRQSVINGKTALFIGAIRKIGGIFAGADNDKVQALNQYGANLGLAFQIQDDLLDYLGDPVKTGKGVGNDFYEGKMTLPLIHVLEKADKKESDFLLDLLKGPQNDRITEFENARDIIKKNDGFEYAAQMAAKLIDTGIASLSLFDAELNGPTLDILTGLARYVITREK